MGGVIRQKRTEALLNTEFSISGARSVSKEAKLAWYMTIGSGENDGKLSLLKRNSLYQLLPVAAIQDCVPSLSRQSFKEKPKIRIFMQDLPTFNVDSLVPFNTM